MVCVFFVQSGTMMTFDDEISIMQSVADLKVKIKEKCQIPIPKQVLLINGGESLDDERNLCSYVAGTDSNPFYLFSTTYNVEQLDILKQINYDDNELKQRLADALSLSVSVSTVKVRALLAQDFYNVARLNIQDFCENMILEQHHQQQGWSAVIANLEEVLSEFKKRWDLFLKMYEKFISARDTYYTLIESFEEDKKILQRIPLIAGLQETQEEAQEEMSLYDWVSASANNPAFTLDDLYKKCKAQIEALEVNIIPCITKNIADVLQEAEKQDRREIEGLGKRLMDLDDLLRKIKKNVAHQCDMAQSFSQNQNSVAHIKDTSILPDLCATHVQQLELIRNCHQRLSEDRARIVKAKNELSKSLCARIGWVQNVEDTISKLDSRMVFVHEHMQRLRKYLEVIQQLHQTPTIYMNAVVEVVRRRSFSQLFLMWASDLSCQQLTFHNEEITRRKEFSSQFEGHFLNALFPGMGDVPPSFATEAPAMFDTKLPNIDLEDVERLRRDVPDFADNLIVPDMSNVENFFLGKLSAKGKEDKVDDAKAVEDKLIQAVSDVGLSSNLDKKLLKAAGSDSSLISAHGLPIPKDDKGCESETDTEEFEKVGQSPLELTFPQGELAGSIPTAAEKIDASTCTEDNLQISRSEHEKLKSQFVDVTSNTITEVRRLRSDLDTIKTQFVNESSDLKKKYGDLGNTWDSLMIEVDRNQKEIVESIMRDNQQEKEEFRYNLMEKEDIIRRLEQDKRAMEDRIESSRKEIAVLGEKLSQQGVESSRKIDELLDQLREKDSEKERCLKELGDNLKLEHRAELDNIKSRFKLMTMERSPSLSSLEKDKSGDYSSMTSHSNLLTQMAENFELDKENAIMEERQHWEKLLAEKTKELHLQFTQDKQQFCEDLSKRLSQEKEKQIDILREREKNLVLENLKHKTTIQQLTECQEDIKADRKIYEKLENLKMENKKLEEELCRIKRSQNRLTSSSAATRKGGSVEGSYAVSSSKNEILTSQPRQLSIDSCKAGDIVLVLWEPAHDCFKILQESDLYGISFIFLHVDCLAKLGLAVTEGKPNKTHCTAEVVNLEYCEAYKEGNRFKLPRGTNFFMVKVKPVKSQSVSGSSQSQDARSKSSEISEIGKPDDTIADNIEKLLAEDSGIVENMEQAGAAVEDTDRLDEEKFWSTQYTPTEDSEKLLSEFCEKEKQYQLEISHYKSAIKELTESQLHSSDSDELEVLKRDNEKLQEELVKVRAEKEALMSSSVALCEGKLDATTSPIAASPPMSEMSRSDIVSSSSSRPHRLNIDSCKVGDVVLLIWDQTHENFKILQESKHTYFLHSDCLEKLGLNIVEGTPNKTYCTGEVVDKEYCQTRKSENRYKVPKGTKFFRVRVKPVPSLHRDFKMSQSVYPAKQGSNMSSSQSVITTFDPLIEETPEKVSRLSTDDVVSISDQSRELSDEGDLELKRKPQFAEDCGIEEATVATEQSDR